ncbi:MAG: hypothetical protein ABIH41_03885 [Nanoarchaeota archaeon]
MRLPAIVALSAVVLAFAVLLIRGHVQGDLVLAGTESYRVLAGSASSMNVFGSQRPDTFAWLVSAVPGQMRVGFGVVLPLVFGALFCSLFYLLVRFGVRSDVSAAFMIGAALISPAMLYLSTTLSVYSVSLSLVAACAWFVSRRRLGMAVLCATCVAPLDVFGWLVSMVFVVLFSSGVSVPDRWRAARIHVFFIALGGVALSLFIFFATGAVPFLSSALTLDARHAFSSLGASAGIPLGVLLLFLINLFLRRTRIRLVPPALLWLLVPLAYVVDATRVYVFFVFAYYAGDLLAWFLVARWQVKFLRPATVLLISCTILFSALSFADRIVLDDPSPALLAAIRQIPLDGLVLSHESYGSYLAYEGRESFVGMGSSDDSRFGRAVFARSIADAGPVLDELGVRHILVTDEMKNGLLWDDANQGLLFVMAHSDRFLLEFSLPSQGIEVWAYAPSDGG